MNKLQRSIVKKCKKYGFHYEKFGSGIIIWFKDNEVDQFAKTFGKFNHKSIGIGYDYNSKINNRFIYERRIQRKKITHINSSISEIVDCSILGNNRFNKRTIQTKKEIMIINPTKIRRI